MVFKYGAGDIPPNVPPENLRIYVLEDGVWDFVGGTVDTTAMTLTVELSHFSTYGGFVQISAPASVGGVAEEARPVLPGTAVGNHRADYLAAAVVAVLALCCGGWYVRRRRTQESW